MKIIFATLTSSRNFSKMFTDLGVNDRLLSYAELKYSQPDFLPTFVSTGLHPPKWQGKRDATWDSPTSRKHIEKPGKAKANGKSKVNELLLKKKRMALIKKIQSNASLEEGMD